MTFCRLGGATHTCLSFRMSTTRCELAPSPNSDIPSDPAGVCVKKMRIFKAHCFRSGNSLASPRLAGVNCLRDEAIPTGDPRRSRIKGGHSVNGCEGRRADILRGPALPAIGGVQDEIGEPHCPTIFCIGKRNRGKFGVDVSELVRPALPAISRLVDASTNGPASRGIEEENVAEALRSRRDILPGQPSV